MDSFAKAISVSASGLRAQATRLRHVAENISNADTPGYRRKIVSFENTVADSQGARLVTVGPVRLDATSLERVYDPTHPLADDSGHFDGSNVNLMIEIADAREAQRSYDANLKLFDQTRQMKASLLDLLRN